MRKHPLVAVALFYIVGIIIADNIILHWLWLGCLWSVALLVATLFPHARQQLLGAAILLAGAANSVLSTAVISPHDIRSLLGNTPQIATVRGRLTETPYQRVYERNQRESWRTIAFLQIDSVSFGRKTNEPACGKVVVSTSGVVASNFYAGQMVEVSGVLQFPNGPVAEGMFDYRKYLRRLGIHYQLQVSSTNDWSVAGPVVGVPFSDRFMSWAQSALARGLPEIDEPVRLLWAMTLGWKTGLSGEVSEPFMRSGTMHVFAISGLHIALIAYLIVSVLRCFSLSRNACCLVVIPLIWIYTGITGWQASAIRSTIMSSVVVLGWSFCRPSNLVNSLGGAALLILVWDPQQLFQAGFQLSFLVVLSLAILCPIFSRWSERLIEGDELLPDVLRPRWHIWLRNGARQLLLAIGTSLAAWIGSMPLIACYFNYLTPSSLLANLLVVPMSSGALASNLGSLAVVSWFPQCAELLNHGAWGLMVGMVRISQWSAELPSGCFNIAAPAPATFLLYYLLLAALVGGWFRHPIGRNWSVAALVILAVVWVFQWQRERSSSRIEILPLHGGEAIYVQDRGSTVLLDGGSEDAVKFTTKPYLRVQGVNNLPAMLLTHGDVKQMGGAITLQKSFFCPQIYTSPLRFKSAVYRKTVETFQKTPKLLYQVKRGDRAEPWTVLHPAESDRFKQADDGTIVAFAKINGVRLLLLSDLGRAGQSALLERTPDLRADIVVAGMPRGCEPLGESLLEAIKPRSVIITDAHYPGSEHAGRRLRDRLSSRQFDVWYTSDVGAVTLVLKNGLYTIRSAIAPLPPRPGLEEETTSESSEHLSD